MNDYRRNSVYPVLEYSDSYSYFLWAKDISSGDLIGGKAFMKWPLYAYFLAFLLKLFNDSVALIYLLQYILGAVNCVLVYFIGKKIFNEKAGFIAALLCVWYGLFVFYDSLLVYTCLSLFLNSILFLLILNLKEKPGKGILFWTGVFLGICTVTQANIAVFGILAILWVLKNKGLGLGRLLYGFSFFILGLVMVVGVVTLRNYLVEKDVVLIAGNAGFNFYSGNNPQATGAFFCPSNIGMNQEDMFRDSRIIANNKSGRNLNTREVSDFWFRQAAGFIREKPFEYLRLFLKKIFLVFSPKEFIHDIEYHFMEGDAGIFRIMFMDLKFILPPALLGIFLGIRKFKVTALLYIALFSLSLGISLFFVTARYRIIIVPYLALFAGFGIFTLLETLKNKNFFRFALFCASLTAVFLLLNSCALNLGKTDAKDNHASFNYHFTKAMRHKNNSEYKNALKELDLAQRERPDNHGAAVQSGAIYFFLNDFGAAEAKFKEAVKINPLAVDAYYNLGLMYNKQERFAEAREMLRQAVFLDPENAQVHFELGLACKSLKEDACAKQEFKAALKKINRWRTAEREAIEKELNSLAK